MRLGWGRYAASGAAFIVLLLTACIAGCPSSLRAAETSVLSAKPYRVLLIVDAWSDPSGLVVRSQKDRFQPVAALLKAWSVPFDILRVDQQRLDATYLFDRSGKIRYGAIVWLADSPSYADQSLDTLQEAVQAGMGLLVVNSRSLDPALDKLLGLKFKAPYTSTDPFRLTGDHYIVRGLKDAEIPSQLGDYGNRLWVVPTTAQVLIEQGVHPLLTVNQIASGGSTVWLGASNLSGLCNSRFWRNLLFRSLVWELGYVVRPNVDYAHSIILELDDWGTADKGFLSYWRYLEPSEQVLRDDFIEPLKQHHAIASAMVNTGYVDRKSKRVIVPWQQEFTDSYGLHQNYASTHKGLEEALAEGVLNIESHGWDHMQADLESAPGPWWTADLQGEGSEGAWYTEFSDGVRGKDAPAGAQLYHMKRSLAELQEDFGVVPLELKPGGDGWSKSDTDFTPMLAARVGFGLFHSDTSDYYLDHEFVLDLGTVVPNKSTEYDQLAKFHPESWPYHPDGPVVLGFHDRDIALDHKFLWKLLAALPADYYTLGTNQYIGILHTQITSSSDGSGFQLSFKQDPHYCMYFEKHPSSWQLWLADPMKQQLKATELRLMVDNQPANLTAADFNSEAVTIHLSAGTGVHTWKLER